MKFIKKNYIRYKAFTLAEVLIVLGIIGIIAALAIPNLYANFQKQVTITSLKKAYSEISQAYTSAVRENGSPDSWTTNAPGSGEAAVDFLKKLAKYLRITENCGNQIGCFPNAGYTFLNQAGTDNYYTRTDLAKAKLTDGTLLALFVDSNSCSVVLGNTLQLNSECAEILVDINGMNKPNVWGKDGFAFLITKYNIIPAGIAGITNTDYDFNNLCLANGSGCTGWILYNDNMDYLHCPASLSWSGNHSCP